VPSSRGAPSPDLRLRLSRARVLRPGRVEHEVAPCQRSAVVANRNPSDRSAQKNFGASLIVSGRDHVTSGEPRAAQQAYETARELLESLKLPDTIELAYLIHTYALMSKCPAPGGPPPTPVGQAACQALANRAVERLRRAIAAGFRDVVWVRTDTDLSALRSRDDFQALIHDMVFPADPFTL
jgi:hypothetical protein